VLDATALTAVDRSVHLVGGGGAAILTGTIIVFTASFVTVNRRRQTQPT
jgi:hypothetical protein|tara:strand:+ start:1168 stop:1314 length:147 start_codon:yes stop_codon:yes gene_type:complete